MFNPAQTEIIERSKHPRHQGTLERPSLIAEGENPFCGDVIRLEVAFASDGKVERALHQCEACAICSAAADFLAEEIIGKSREEIAQLPSADVIDRLGLPLSPTRLKCALLPLESLKQQLKEA